MCGVGLVCCPFEPLARHQHEVEGGADVLGGRQTGVPLAPDEPHHDGRVHARLATPTMTPDHAGPIGDADRPASDSAELSDEEWLAAIPLRAKLQDKRHFDEEAILWRRLQPKFMRI